MKRTSSLKALLSVGLLGAIVAGSVVSADAAEYKGKSQGSVSFTTGSIKLPGEGENPGGTEEPETDPSANFGLLYVPKEFTFMATEVPTSTVVGDTLISLDTPTADNPATKHYAVADVRGARTAGWKLEAKLTTPLSSTKGSVTKTLAGATIEMSQGLNKLNPTTWDTSKPADDDVHKPDTVLDKVSLSTATQVVMSASKETATNAADGRGEGYWQGELTDIQLKVPAGDMNNVRADETYTGTVDWVLTDSI
ncbi:WxL domain-containing protein [Enterococcus sp. 669A]|uniref:WxL domain-containing protein n=1 Tax=Candidatus Enterococcus moelleringii TaxID=2815325 RepID=A0ABS3LE04_9ENTE|nr:WxL domain-containing protein [Enterococcus sp. 669A]MBO1307871.1 WxL domain-containing protein [Enterococcus sp. 669A]